MIKWTKSEWAFLLEVMNRMKIAYEEKRNMSYEERAILDKFRKSIMAVVG